MLQRLVADGQIFAVSGTAFAVTPACASPTPRGDDEELAEVALREAALGSLRLLAAEHDADDAGMPVPDPAAAAAVLVADVNTDDAP